MSVGGSHGCAVTVGGRAECWGSNATAQLGAVTTDSCGQDGAGRPRPCSRVPVPVTGETRFAMTSAGVGHTCGLDEEGFAFCWGANTFGQRGDGLIGEIAAEPIPVVGALRFRAVSVGLNHTCGHAESGELFCWGANDVGQLGTGNLNIGLGPRRVLLR